MAKNSTPKVSNKRVKEIWKKHSKAANRNETYSKDTIDIVKSGKTPKKTKKK